MRDAIISPARQSAQLRFGQRRLVGRVALLAAALACLPFAALCGPASLRMDSHVECAAFLRPSVEAARHQEQETRPRRVHPEKEEPAPTPSPSPSKPAKKVPDKKQNDGPATVRHPRPKPARPASSPASKPDNSSAKGFTVQFGAFLDSAKANRLAEQLVEKGYRAEVSAITDGHKRTWRLVRVGVYEDRGHANAAALEIQQKTGVTGIVRPIGAF